MFWLKKKHWWAHLRVWRQAGERFWELSNESLWISCLKYSWEVPCALEPDLRILPRSKVVIASKEYRQVGLVKGWNVQEHGAKEPCNNPLRCQVDVERLHKFPQARHVLVSTPTTQDWYTIHQAFQGLVPDFLVVILQESTPWVKIIRCMYKFTLYITNLDVTNPSVNQTLFVLPITSGPVRQTSIKITVLGTPKVFVVSNCTCIS